MTGRYKRRIFAFDCDIYGHLNNAIYQNIYEEARSELLDNAGYSLKILTKRGIFLYLTRVELIFKKEVTLGSTVSVATRATETTRVRFTWYQEMFNDAGELCNTATISGAFVKDGKPWRIPADMLSDFKRLES